MSVVVPPISATMAVRVPARKAAPARLAAGPESTVSTGRERAYPDSRSDPSPLTTISRQDSPSPAMMLSVAATSLSSRLTSRAFSTAVRARRGPPSEDDSSWLQVTGAPVSSRRRSRARLSCAGLRVAKWPATAKADISPSVALTASRMAASSSGVCWPPSAAWPPAMKKAGSWPRARARSARCSASLSKPIIRSATRPPTPSTTALVARVVDSDTRPISAASPSKSSRTRRMAPPTPIDRSSRVVSDFPVARTVPVAVSRSAASV